MQGKQEQLMKQNLRSGKVNPAVIVAAALVLAGAALAGWYFMGDDAPENDLKVIVDGKEVDAAKFMKDAKIELKDGPKIDLKNPHGVMSELVGKYFALPAGPQRLKYLDDMIDQQEKVRKELGITNNPDGTPQIKMTGAPTTGPSDGSGPKKTIVMRSGSAGAQDSMPPELRAQLAEYLKAINDRRAARGLPPQQGMMMMRTNKSN